MDSVAFYIEMTYTGLMSYLNNSFMEKQALSSKQILSMLQGAAKKSPQAKEHLLKRLGQRNLAVRNNQFNRFNKMMAAKNDPALMAKLEKRVPSNWGLGTTDSTAGVVSGRDLLRRNRFMDGPRLGAINHSLLNRAPVRMLNGSGNPITVQQWLS